MQVSRISLIFLFLLFANVFKSQIKNNPVASFSFNERKDYDEISKRKIKLVGVNYTEDRFGNANNAVYTFGNEYSYINLGNYKALKQRAGSISLWVKIERDIWMGRGVRANPIMLTKCREEDDFYEAYGIYYQLENHKFVINSARDSLRQAVVVSNDPYLFYEWHHLAITYDDSYYSLYIDGVLQRKAIKNFETKFLASDSVIIGISPNKKNLRFMEGAVDDIAFYDHVISEKEINNLFHAPNPNKNRIILNWILLIIVILAAIVAIYFFTKHRLSIQLKKEQQRLELYNIVLETELRVNRALMNPHFVFNSLNALQNFILKNQNAEANHYLVKFSKLMRRILESNMSDVITLEFEIQLLKSYLEIEDLRFEENIKYFITVDPGIVPSAMKIPIMMLQPFVENAIWHGLLKKEGEKLLTISFSVVEDKYVLCTIDDNGLGRKKDDALNLEKNSLATGFIEQRLNLLNRIHHLNCSLSIEDKPDNNGTVVKILLPILKNIG